MAEGPTDSVALSVSCRDRTQHTAIHSLRLFPGLVEGWVCKWGPNFVLADGEAWLCSVKEATTFCLLRRDRQFSQLWSGKCRSQVGPRAHRRGLVQASKIRRSFHQRAATTHPHLAQGQKGHEFGSRPVHAQAHLSSRPDNMPPSSRNSCFFLFHPAATRQSDGLLPRCSSSGTSRIC